MKPTVLIIGGGYGGLRTAAGLADHANVTVIDRNTYFHHKAAALRAMLFSGWEDRTYVDFDKIGMDATFVQGDVTKIDPNACQLTLGDGTEMAFDYVVMATGSRTELPTERLDPAGNAARTSVTGLKDTYAKAKRVIIVGDGPVGVEMAGEYRDLSDDIDITLVSSAALPMMTVGNAKFSRKVADLLARRNVKRISGQKVSEVGKTHVTLADGRTLSADVVVQAVGITPNTDWIKGFAPEWLDVRGQVRVGEDLSVTGHDRIFALGDCSDIDEPKMLKMADTQGKFLATSIIQRINGEATAPYDRFTKKLTILPFGAKDGVALLPLGQEGTVVWRPLGRFLVVKRKGTQLLSNMFPSAYATSGKT